MTPFRQLAARADLQITVQDPDQTSPNGRETAASSNGRPGWRPKVLLVLGGGGMRGFAHIGVIRALERLGVQVDEVVGTSMGAVMGALWASGRDSFQIEEAAGAISIRDYLKLNLVKFLVRGYRHASVYKGQHFRAALTEMLGDGDFDTLARPFICNALSLNRGHMRYFGLPGDRGVSVVDAVYASACLPAVFEPPEIEGEHFIDGGMAEGLGLKVAQARKPDVIIGVDLSAIDHQTSIPYRASLPHILFRTYSIMGNALNEHTLHHYADEKVVLIRPKVQGIGLLDQPDTNELVRLGERETLEALSTHALTRWVCDPKVVREVDRTIARPRDYVHLDVDMNACIHCGICAVTCATNGYVDVPMGPVVRKLHNHECTRDAACERSCPTGAIRLRNL